MALYLNFASPTWTPRHLQMAQSPSSCCEVIIRLNQAALTRLCRLKTAGKA
jgi:hypothetical protein